MVHAREPLAHARRHRLGVVHPARGLMEDAGLVHVALGAADRAPPLRTLIVLATRTPRMPSGGATTLPARRRAARAEPLVVGDERRFVGAVGPPFDATVHDVREAGPLLPQFCARGRWGEIPIEVWWACSTESCGWPLRVSGRPEAPMAPIPGTMNGRRRSGA